jgi:site-specific recombinase XerC
METCLRALSRRGSRDWDVVDALIRHRVDLADVFDHWTRGTLDELRAQLNDLDLGPMIDEWELEAERTLAAETFRKYRAQVRVLFPADLERVDAKRGDIWKRRPVFRSSVTRAWLKEQLGKVPRSNTNRRRHGAAWVSCLDYVTERGAFEENPMRAVSLPSSNKVDRHRIDRFRDVLRYVDAMPDGIHRAMAALREGAGLEMESVLPLRACDIVDAEHRILWAHGDKNEYRDRQVIVETWAWKRFVSYVEAGGFLPDARLFPTTHKRHATVHNETCAALRSRGFDIPRRYTLHNCRNSYAVRNVRRGRPEWEVANNLGHADTTTVRRLYGKFRPKVADLMRVSKRAQQSG